MNYKEYYKECRDSYSNNINVEEFYNKPVRIIPETVFDEKYYSFVDVLSCKVKNEFDSITTNHIMIECQDFWKYEEQVSGIADYIVPYLESSLYGCYLYVDKVYIYRTTKISKRSSSYLWHYDNNPSEIVKNIIYLNDVTNSNSPFEYMADNNDNGVIIQPSRTGPNNWRPAPNNSRVTMEKLFELHKKGYKPKKILGKKGTTFSFNNDCVHRVNPIKEGYRDVLNIRVKPSLKKIEKYIDKRWTSGYDRTGAVNPNPERIFL